MSRFVDGKIDIFIAEESTYGVAPAVASFKQISTPLQETVEHSGDVAMIDRDTSRADLMHDPLDVGRQSGVYNFDIPLRGNSTAPTDGQTAELFTDLTILKALVGVDATQITYDITGGNTTTFTYSGADPDVGSIYAVFPTTSNADPQYRMITAVNTGTDTATMHKAVSPACVDGIAGAGINFYPSRTETVSHSIQVSSMPSGSDYAYSMYSGCHAGDLVIKGKVADDKTSYLTASITLNADNHTKGKSPTVSVAGGASSLVDPEANAVQYRATSIKIDGEEIPHAEFELTCGLEWSEDINALQTNGRNKPVLTAINPMLKLGIPRDTSLTFDPLNYGPTNEYDIIIEAGTYPNSFAAVIQKAVISEQPEETESNGIMMYNVMFLPIRPALAYDWAFALFGRTAP
jgi:hypothetical protein